MTTFNWTVDAMDCYPQSQGNADVVYNVHWRCTGVNGDASASVYGTCAVPYSGSKFTPYDSLTQDQVLGWIWGDGVNKTEIETNVGNQVNAILNPTTVTPPLPWSATDEV